MENYEILWKSALADLESTVSASAMHSFISLLTPVDLNEGVITLWCQKNMIADAVESHYSGQIRDALTKASSGVVNGFAIVVGKDKETSRLQVENKKTDDGALHGSPVNPSFTFDSFVVGPSNQLLFGAAKAVAENPGVSFNPLFIYGGTGLGKTHILMAIHNYLQKNDPTKRVVYTTCEHFTNQLIDLISHGKNNASDFRRSFRGVDVLLIDDIQFLSGKTQTQSEFFHTFNELVNQNKQVVIASDRPPQEIEVLEERLRTRFEAGLLADVQKPDFETRIAILKRKAEERKVAVGNDVLAFIAERGGEDVRSMIGKLTTAIFASQLHEKPLTVELAAEALKESVTDAREEVQADDIIDSVANYYKIKRADILGKKKNREFAEPRQVCMYLMTELLTMPLTAIGEKIGGRDHATVIYARDKIASLQKLDNRLATEVNDIKNLILKK